MQADRAGFAAGGLVSTLLTWGCAREASPARAPDPTFDVQHEDVQAWLDAWNSHDMARISVLFSPDGVVHQPRSAEPLSTSSMQPLFEGAFRAFPDIHFDVLIDQPNSD